MKEIFKYIGLLLIGLFFLHGEANGEILPESGQEEAEAYQLRIPEEDFFEKFRRDEAFNYHQEVAKWPGWMEDILEWLDKHVFRIHYNGKWDSLDLILKISAVLLVIFLIYRLIRSKIFFVHVRKDKPLEGVEVLVGESLSRDSYAQLVRDAEKKGDFVLAIRIHYWYILYLMDCQALIHWELHKTNRSYCYELKDEWLKKDFERLTWIFDCVCYGEFEVRPDLYAELSGEFDRFREKWGK